MWEKAKEWWRELAGHLTWLAEQIKEFADFAIGLGALGVVPLFIAVVCLLIAGLLGIVVGPFVVIISVIALVISCVGYLTLEDIGFSFAKPLLGIGGGILWSIIGLSIFGGLQILNGLSHGWKLAIAEPLASLFDFVEVFFDDFDHLVKHASVKIAIAGAVITAIITIVAVVKGIPR